MKKTTLNLLVFVFSVVALTACGNQDLEKRVADLEERIAKLENGGAATGEAMPASLHEGHDHEVEPEAKEKPEGPLPVLTFQKEEHDFGKIDEGDVVEHTFEFTNTGDADLVISQAQATCGCTVPEWPKEPIAPGEKGKITARFNSAGKPNLQSKTITITANTWPEKSTLRIKADVAPKAQASAETDGPVKN